jgi:S-adenosylmethionine synthetase
VNICLPNLVFFIYSSNQPTLIKEVDRANPEEQGADQGMMFGYATNETEKLHAIGTRFTHKLLQELAI